MQAEQEQAATQSSISTGDANGTASPAAARPGSSVTPNAADGTAANGVAHADKAARIDGVAVLAAQLGQEVAAAGATKQQTAFVATTVFPTPVVFTGGDRPEELPAGGSNP